MLLKDFDSNSTGKKIRLLLLDQDESVAKLANDMGISRQALYVKLNTNRWTVADIKKVAEVLRVNPKDLI